MLYIIWKSFRLRKVEQKFMQYEMGLESTVIHSTAYINKIHQEATVFHVYGSVQHNIFYE